MANSTLINMYTPYALCTHIQYKYVYATSPKLVVSFVVVVRKGVQGSSSGSSMIQTVSRGSGHRERAISLHTVHTLGITGQGWISRN